MKVATLNCNGFRACVRKGFFDWLANRQPRHFVFQEVRFAQEGLVGQFASQRINGIGLK